MTKKRSMVFLVTVLILTNIISFILGNTISIKSKNKAILSNDEYNRVVGIYNKYSKLDSIKNFLDENFLGEIDETKSQDGIIKGLFQSLDDPYSVYMDQDEFTSFMDQTSGIYAGIGIIVTPGDDNLITVVSPIEGTPGERAGLRPGDKIISVDGVEYRGDEMDKAVKVMKGEENTEVTLTITRIDKDGNRSNFDVDIVREIIRLVTVQSEVLEDNIGYLKITSFDDKTYTDFIEHLNELMSQDIKGLVLDLRNNPGGLLNVCVDIADELLGEGTIVYQETKSGEKIYEKSDKNMIDIPLSVLINEGSASASEIVAGAIKDHNRGILIGNTTFGKGVVQRIRDLQDGTGFKITISEYFTPNGTKIHGIGVIPDIEVVLPEDVVEFGPDNLDEDLQLQRAIEELK